MEERRSHCSIKKPSGSSIQLGYESGRELKYRTLTDVESSHCTAQRCMGQVDNWVFTASARKHNLMDFRSDFSGHDYVIRAALWMHFYRVISLDLYEEHGNADGVPCAFYCATCSLKRVG